MYIFIVCVCSDGVTLGMVVGILERDKREYVATFEVSSTGPLEVLEPYPVVPWPSV